MQILNQKNDAKNLFIWNLQKGLVKIVNDFVRGDGENMNSDLDILFRVDLLKLSTTLRKETECEKKADVRMISGENKIVGRKRGKKQSWFIWSRLK